MIIKPVYLVEPEPDPRVRLTRRTMVIGSLAMFGAGVGSAMFGRAMMGSDSELFSDSERRPPIQLEYARRLAAGPETVLFAQSTNFVTACRDWPDDAALQSGLRRLVRVVVSADAGPARGVRARMLAAYFRRHPPGDPELRAAVRQLHRLTDE